MAVAFVIITSIGNSVSGIYTGWHFVHDSYIIRAEENPQNQSYPKTEWIGSCMTGSLHAGFEVFYAPDLGKNIGGRTHTDPLAIFLRNTDIDTVAHEVSHAVDTIVSEKGIQDGETRAYLQGYFTDCVYTIAERWSNKHFGAPEPICHI